LVAELAGYLVDHLDFWLDCHCFTSEFGFDLHVVVAFHQKGHCLGDNFAFYPSVRTGGEES
jgi:hypothetical protein